MGLVSGAAELARNGAGKMDSPIRAGLVRGCNRHCTRLPFPALNVQGCL